MTDRLAEIEGWLERQRYYSPVAHVSYEDMDWLIAEMKRVHAAQEVPSEPPPRKRGRPRPSKPRMLTLRELVGIVLEEADKHQAGFKHDLERWILSLPGRPAGARTRRLG
jgi:hypothetical protein